MLSGPEEIFCVHKDTLLLYSKLDFLPQITFFFNLRIREIFGSLGAIINLLESILIVSLQLMLQMSLLRGEYL